jgi:hypothetical protein
MHALVCYESVNHAASLPVLPPQYRVMLGHKLGTSRLRGKPLRICKVK